MKSIYAPSYLGITKQMLINIKEDYLSTAIEGDINNEGLCLAAMNLDEYGDFMLLIKTFMLNQGFAWKFGIKHKIINKFSMNFSYAWDNRDTQVRIDFMDNLISQFD